MSSEELRARVEASGLWRLLGMRVKSAGGGRAELEVTLSDRLREPHGGAANGVVCAMIDSAVGVAIATRLEPHLRPVTVQLRVSHLLTAETDDLTAAARVVHLDGEVGVGTAEVRDAKGRLVAHGTATYLIGSSRPGGGGPALSGDTGPAIP
ncbi:MAG: PaaI family thioesterase [Firmicutes bacterium]|nr:PaaI family thioesterase [Bacillota bacterium]